MHIGLYYSGTTLYNTVDIDHIMLALSDELWYLRLRELISECEPANLRTQAKRHMRMLLLGPSWRGAVTYFHKPICCDFHGLLSCRNSSPDAPVRPWRGRFLHIVFDDNHLLLANFDDCFCSFSQSS